MPTDDVQVQDGLLIVARTDEGAQVRLALRGELDLANVPTLESALDDAIDSGKKVVVDLGRLEFLDSTGLALIVRMLGRSDAERFSFVPSKSGNVSRLLSLTGLDDRMAIERPSQKGLPSLPAA